MIIRFLPHLAHASYFAALTWAAINIYVAGPGHDLCSSKGMVRTLDCACGARLQAAGDSALFEVAKKHASEAHDGDPQYSELDLLTSIERSAYTVEPPNSVREDAQ